MLNRAHPRAEEITRVVIMNARDCAKKFKRQEEARLEENISNNLKGMHFITNTKKYASKVCPSYEKVMVHEKSQGTAQIVACA